MKRTHAVDLAMGGSLLAAMALPLPSRWHARIVFVALLTAVLVSPARAATDRSHRHSSIDVGSYHLDVPLQRSWTVEAKPEAGYALFGYGSADDRLSDSARVGIFQLKVPPGARQARQQDLAVAYGINDAAGVQQVLSGAKPKLRLFNRDGRQTHGGVLFEFRDETEIDDRRTRSTRFVRTWIFFPESFAADGRLFIIAGMQNASHPIVRPYDLDLMNALIAGLQLTSGPARADNTAQPP